MNVKWMEEISEIYLWKCPNHLSLVTWHEGAYTLLTWANDGNRMRRRQANGGSFVLLPMLYWEILRSDFHVDVALTCTAHLLFTAAAFLDSSAPTQWFEGYAKEFKVLIWPPKSPEVQSVVKFTDHRTTSELLWILYLSGSGLESTRGLTQMIDGCTLKHSYFSAVRMETKVL